MPQPLVLHVLPVDLARGAQTYARQLRDRLDGDGDGARHRTLTLFASAGTTLQADVRLDVPAGPLRRAGLDPRAVLRLRRAYGRLAPAVVVAHGGEPLKYAVAAGVPRARLVYLKIGIGSTRLHGARARLYRFLLGRAGAVAAVSDDVAREARELGVDGRRLRVIPNGRDVERYAPRARDAAGARARVRLAFVGHLVATKRPVRFVELVGALTAAGCPVEGVVAGDGPERPAVEAAARGLPVEVLGEVADVPALLGGADVFVFTSVPAGEGMPGVLIEAGLAALPVVSTDVPGVAEVLEPGVTGLVAGVDDFDALVAAVRGLVDDPARRARMGAAARERCVARFGMEESVRRWHALLDAVAEGECASST